MFSCEKCPKSFSSKSNMQRHLKEAHYGKKRSQKFTSENLRSQNFEPQQSVTKDIGNYHLMGSFDIRLKENFKLFISGHSRCGKDSICIKIN